MDGGQRVTDRHRAGVGERRWHGQDAGRLEEGGGAQGYGWRVVGDDDDSGAG